MFKFSPCCAVDEVWQISPIIQGDGDSIRRRVLKTMLKASQSTYETC
jgi:hypothetical protein